MTERVVVIQDHHFQTEFRASDPNNEESDEVEIIAHLHDLTPYGMLLASVGSCTAIVVNTYANHHNIPIDAVIVDASYDRVFTEDCEDCDENNVYDEIIQEKINFKGKINLSQRKRLHKVAKACSIRRILEHGIKVKTEEKLTEKRK
jgi:putative redox protein